MLFNIILKIKLVWIKLIKYLIVKRWINRYNLEKSIKKHNRKSISYKITKEHAKYLLKLLKDNELITDKIS